MKLLSICLLLLFCSIQLSAQNPKQDIILKVNGEEMAGKVTELGDSAVKFVYNGETLVYSVRKADIFRITYSSGRTELFTKPAATAATVVENTTTKSIAGHHNRIAILPFHFITDNQTAGDEMSYKVQNECFNFLTKHAGEHSILDPRTTNALLAKAGADMEKIRGFTMDELADILGVEYIIDGTVTQNKGSQYSYKSEDYKATAGKDNKSGKEDAKLSGSSSSSTTQNYETSISVNIYTDKNSAIFNEDRRSFWTGTDAYKNALQYLLKRCPLYRK